jgi:hypothetical protein
MFLHIVFHAYEIVLPFTLLLISRDRIFTADEIHLIPFKRAQIQYTLKYLHVLQTVLLLLLEP